MAKRRTRYVFRLDITYPPASRMAGWQPENWRALLGTEDWGRPEIDHAYVALLTDEQIAEAHPFRWPLERLFLTRENAMARAARLRAAGALVNVVRSQPIVWPDDSPAETRRIKPTPDTPLQGADRW